MPENESSIKQQLLISEYNSLKAELKDLVSEMNLMARYAVLGSAAIFAFIAATEKANHYYDRYLIWIPLIMSALFAFRTHSLYDRLELISNYIENKIESKVNESNGWGWESYLNKSIKKIKPFGKSKAQLATIIFWIALLLLCSLLPVVYKQQ